MDFFCRGNKNLTHFGPIASGVPGFVAGTWELKQRLGNPKISWRRYGKTIV